VGKGVTLTLDSNITLEGLSDNNAALVMVHSGGALKMKADSKISNNTISSGVGGGGVIVNGNGTFTMDGGEISNNTVSGGGGGVYVASNATFTMNKGNISNNTGDSGGGVHISISGTFILNDGNISGNTAFRGSGVYISTSGKFTMNKGNISNNTATDHGGGVFAYAGSFTMNNGNISDNTAANDGGGVYLNNANGGAKFTMSGGAISGNTASSGNGGGVLVKGSLTKQAGGVIYGSEAGEPLKNIAGSGAGHAVYVAEDKKRDSTAGEGVTLSSGSLDNWE
jgi:hypothetical protein